MWGSKNKFIAELIKHLFSEKVINEKISLLL